MELEQWTFFVNRDGGPIASMPGIFPGTLTVGMKFFIHSYGDDNPFAVEDWWYKLDHPDQKPGLYVVLS